jgi:hypothetical protein
MVAFVPCRACWLTLTLFLSLSFSNKIFCYIFFSFFSSLPLLFFSSSFLFFLSLFLCLIFSFSCLFFLSLFSLSLFVSLFSFFGKTQPTPSLVWMDLVARCSPIFPHAWTFVFHDTKNQVCYVGVFLRVCSITNECQVCS